MSDFTIELSEAFLDRFPKGERAVAAARARYALCGMLYSYSPNEMDCALNTSLTEFHFRHDFSLATEAPRNLPLKPYFDPDAMVVIQNEDGSEARLPALSVLAESRNLWCGYYKELLPVVAGHHDIEGTAGTFDTPFVNAIYGKNTRMLTLLAYNNGFNPNAIQADPEKYSLKRGGRVVSADKVTYVSPPLPVVELLCNECDSKLTFFDLQPISDTIIRYIDRGALVNEKALSMINENPVLAPVKEHIAAIKVHLSDIDPEECTPADIIKAYAVNALSSLIPHLADQPGGNHAMMRLRTELPDWINKILEPAYEILEQDSWAATATSRDTDLIGRFA